MKEVLVLNANFEPINVTNIYRALNLIIADKATLILNGRGVIKTVSTAYPIPSIIRLHAMIHRPRPQVHLSKKEVFRRDHNICQYCGKTCAELTIDHVIPKHIGGKHIWTNVVTACPHCNHQKGGRTPTEAHMALITQPEPPLSSAMYIFGNHLLDNSEWISFIEHW